MFKSLKTIALIATVLFIGMNSVQAQENDQTRREMRQEFRQEHREKMLKFHSEEVEPVLRKMKEKFDGSIAKEDLDKLNELRAEAAKLRKTHLEERKKYREMRTNNPDSCFCKERNERRANAKEHRAEMQKLLDKLEPIAEKYKETLALVHETFESELNAIKSKRQEARKEMRNDCNKEFRKNGRKGRGHGNKGFGRRGHRGNRGDMKGQGMMFNNPERFLLWDGTPKADLDK